MKPCSILPHHMRKEALIMATLTVENFRACLLCLQCDSGRFRLAFTVSVLRFVPEFRPKILARLQLWAWARYASGACLKLYKYNNVR